MNEVITSDRRLTLESARRLFEEFVPAAVLNSYRLPGVGSKDRVVVGISGGADSAVLAIFSAIYLSPRYDVQYLFTDTGAEPSSCHETLDALEGMLGIKIERLRPEKDLFGLIESYDGFLPGTKARYCTRELKIKPLLEFLSKEDRKTVSLAGIRYDEQHRDGLSLQYSMETQSAAFPFIDLKINRQAVFSILDRTVGIPSTYAYRSRSGCYLCFFQRNSEYLGLLHHDPEAYLTAEQLEKLSPDDMARWDLMPASLSEAGLRGYYPVPSFVDVRTKHAAPPGTQTPPQELKRKSNTQQVDLFEVDDSVPEEMQVLFAAYALYCNDGLSLYGGSEFTPGVYWQEFVAFSTSISGLKTATANFHKFRQNTPMPHIDPGDMKIVIAKLEFPKDTLDLLPPSEGSYTWKSKVSLRQLRQVAGYINQSLEYAEVARRIQGYTDVINSSSSASRDKQLAAEEGMVLIEQIKKLGKPAGRLVWEGVYQPASIAEGITQLDLLGVGKESTIRPAREGVEYDEVPTACFACSI